MSVAHELHAAHDPDESLLSPGSTLPLLDLDASVSHPASDLPSFSLSPSPLKPNAGGFPMMSMTKRDASNVTANSEYQNLTNRGRMNADSYMESTSNLHQPPNGKKSLSSFRNFSRAIGSFPTSLSSSHSNASSSNVELKLASTPVTLISFEKEAESKQREILTQFYQSINSYKADPIWIDAVWTVYGSNVWTQLNKKYPGKLSDLKVR
jgi:hypothetical protein